VDDKVSIQGKRESRTYSTPFLWVCACKTARAFEFFLVHRHVVIFGLERLPLRHLFSQSLFLVHHGCAYPNQGILVPPLHMEHVLHLI
jgi:hypothetical protein